MHLPLLFFRTDVHNGRLKLLALGTSVCLVLLAIAAAFTRDVSGPHVSIHASQGAAPAGPISQTSPPAMELSATSVRQGSAFAVRLRSPDITAASVTFAGHDYPMTGSGPLWYAVIGAGQPVGSVDMLPAGDYPLVISYQYAGSSAVSQSQASLTVLPVEFPVDAIEVPEEKVGLLDPQLELQEAAVLQRAYSDFTPVQLWHGPFAMPVQGAITTNFGSRRSYQGGPAAGSHSGVDIGVPLGTPVTASAAGRVAWTGQLPDRGNGVIVDHGLGVFSGYFHLSRIMAQPGQNISIGETVGLTGTTGLSTGPHVHWEIVVSQINIDGLQFMRLDLP